MQLNCFKSVLRFSNELHVPVLTTTSCPAFSSCSFFSVFGDSILLILFLNFLDEMKCQEAGEYYGRNMMSYSS